MASTSALCFAASKLYLADHHRTHLKYMKTYLKRPITPPRNTQTAIGYTFVTTNSFSANSNTNVGPVLTSRYVLHRDTQFPAHQGRVDSELRTDGAVRDFAPPGAKNSRHHCFILIYYLFFGYAHFRPYLILTPLPDKALRAKNETGGTNPRWRRRRRLPRLAQRLPRRCARGRTTLAPKCLPKSRKIAAKAGPNEKGYNAWRNLFEVK